MTDLNALAERLERASPKYPKSAWMIVSKNDADQAAQALRGMGWRDMDSAPHGQRILADVRYDPPHRYFGSGRVEIGTLDGIGWAGEGIMGEPVAWMPLPAARSALKERGGGE